MSVYKHQQGNYQSYRVARSVDGKLCQEYFPRTRKGYQEAKKRDEELARDQERAQQFFTGPALRWQKKPKKVERRTATTKSKSTIRTKTSSKRGVRSPASVSMKASPKRVTHGKASAPSRSSARRVKA
ncbi:MAG: hypothetical protein OXG15_10500 [Gammaproteobacteria bacterium]|nr:hypothetical protein [Gammaproteobacteria bacterium]